MKEENSTIEPTMDDILAFAKKKRVEQLKINFNRLESIKIAQERYKKKIKKRKEIMLAVEKLGIPHAKRGDVIREYNLAKYRKEPITLEEAWSKVIEKN